MNNRLQPQTGFVLTSILVISGVFVIMIGILFAEQANRSQTILRDYLQLQSRSLAEGGLDHALAELRSNGAYAGETLALGAGSVSILITPNDLNRHIEAVGTLGTVSRTLAIDVVADPGSPGNTFSFAIQSDTGGTQTATNKNPTISGNLFTNGDISLLGSGSHVTGDVTASGTVTNRGSIDGTITQQAPLRPLPEVNVEYWQDQAEAGQTHTGDYAITTNGSYTLGAPDHIGVIEGRLLIPANATVRITGPLWIKGSGGSAIEISGNPRIELDPSFSGNETVILSDGRLTFSGNAIFSTGETTPTKTMLLMTTWPGSAEPDTVAVAINSNTRFINTAIFAPNGQIAIGPSASGLSVTSMTALRLFINSNAKITYATGLLTANFSGQAGPTGGTYAVKTGSYAEPNP